LAAPVHGAHGAQNVNMRERLPQRLRRLNRPYRHDLVDRSKGSFLTGISRGAVNHDDQAPLVHVGWSDMFVHPNTGCIDVRLPHLREMQRHFHTTLTPPSHQLAAGGPWDALYFSRRNYAPSHALQKGFMNGATVERQGSARFQGERQCRLGITARSRSAAAPSTASSRPSRTAAR